MDILMPPKNRPVVDHICFFDENGEWVKRTFPPVQNGLKWAEEVKCPDSCKLAYQCHPLVRDANDEHVYHKLCTLTAIKAGLIRIEDILNGEEE